MTYKKMPDFVLAMLIIAEQILSSCNKQVTQSPSSVASINVVNVLNNSAPLILAQGSILSAIGNFSNINPLSFGSTAVLTAKSGSERIYAVQSNGDTASINEKGGDFMFNSVLSFKGGGLYSLFITGSDTTNPDFLYTEDQFSKIQDSSMGIRFVNLSAGSNSISVNLEGNPNGSEVGNLSYKGISGYKGYVNNSSTVDYMFVVRDATTGDSLTQFDFLISGSSNNGYGLTDPSNSLNNGTLLTFKHITIAIYGSQAANTNNPLNTLMTDNY